MKKRYSNLFIKAKNGKKFSNFFYRFAKPFLIIGAVITFSTIFIIHSVTFNDYKNNTKNNIYIFNVTYDNEEYLTTILPRLKQNYKNIEFTYFDYNNLTKEGKKLAEFYHVDSSFSPSRSNSGRAVFAGSNGMNYMLIYITYNWIANYIKLLGFN